MMPDEPDLPPKELLLQRAEAMPRIVSLRNYCEVMRLLKSKGYNYRQIADWMSEELNVPITRSQVVYALTTPDIILDQDEQDEYAEELMDKAEEEKSRSK